MLRPRPRRHGGRPRIAGVEVARLVEQADRLGIVLPPVCPQMRQRAQHQVVGGEAFRAFALGERDLRLLDRRMHRARDLFGDLVLEIEQVVDHAVVGIGPEMRAAGRVDELCRHPDSVMRLAQRSFEHVADAERPRDLADISRPALVGIG